MLFAINCFCCCSFCVISAGFGICGSFRRCRGGVVYPATPAAFAAACGAMWRDGGQSGAGRPATGRTVLPA